VAFDWAVVVIPLHDASRTATESAIVFSDRAAPLDVRWASPQLVQSEDCGVAKSATCGVLDKQNGVFTVPSGAGSREAFIIAPPRAPDSNNDPWRPGAEWSPCFVSARLSQDGQHLVAGTTFGLLYLLPDFSRILRGDAPADKVVQRLNLHEPVSHISWDSHESRIMIILDSKDVLVIALDQAHLPRSVKPNVSLDSARAIKLHPPTDLRLGGSYNLQTTRTRLWFSARPDKMYQQSQAKLAVSGNEADVIAGEGELPEGISSGEGPR